VTDLTHFPALRYHAAGTRPEREAAREECCRRYGREEIDTGRMYRFLRDEIEELVRRNQRKPDST